MLLTKGVTLPQPNFIILWNEYFIIVRPVVYFSSVLYRFIENNIGSNYRISIVLFRRIYACLYCFQIKSGTFSVLCVHAALLIGS